MRYLAGLLIAGLAVVFMGSSILPRSQPGPAVRAVAGQSTAPPAAAVLDSSAAASLVARAPAAAAAVTGLPPLADGLAPDATAASAPVPAVRGPVPAPWAPPPLAIQAIAMPPTIEAAAAIVVDDASGAVLYERDAHRPLAPASLTKIATAILAVEEGDLDAWVEVDVDSRTMRGSTVMGLVPGDRFRLRDLLYGLMLASGNDAALAIGRHVAGSDPAFVERMNALAARLGLSESRFINPHGLGGVGHASSAYDIAMLARYGMRLPAFAEVVGARTWTARGSRTIELSTLIDSSLSGLRGADGVKSGYTRSAGKTLAVSATRDGHRVYAVVLNDAERERDAHALIEWAFANYRWPQPAPQRAS